MGCDHLHAKIFKESMNKIKLRHSEIFTIYKVSLLKAYEEFKRAWDTPRGWNTVNNLSECIYGRISSMNETIEHNYTVMDDSGTAWAKSQQVMMFSIPPIPPLKYECWSTGDHDGEINEVKKEEVLEAAEKIKNALNRINECMNDMQKVTFLDETFGYYSTGGENPRETIHKSINKARDGVAEDFTKYIGNMNNLIDEDIKEREAAISKGIDDLAK